MAHRKKGDRVEEYFGSVSGTITEVHIDPQYPDAPEYSIEWDDGEYPDELWDEQNLKPLGEG